MPRRSPEELKKIRKGFLGSTAYGEPAEEAPAKKEEKPAKAADVGLGKDEEEDELDAAPDAPIKEKITKSILRMLRKKGAPSAE